MKRSLMIVTGIILTLVLVFAGCSAKMSKDDVSMSEPETVYQKTTMNDAMPQEDAGFGRSSESSYEDDGEYTQEVPEPSLDSPEELSEKIIYNVYASVLVDDVEAAVASITAKVKSLGGYISYSNSYNSNGYVYANVELRVPAENLSKLEEYAGSVGKVEERTMSTDNITENYYDIKNRLNSATKEEAQLLEVLEKAETIEDILLVREQLSSVQERIESYKGKIRLWDSLVDYSTVTYNIRPVPTLDTDKDDSPRLIKLDETWRAMKRGFNNSIIAVANFFSFLLRALAVLAIPLIICGVIAVIVIIIVKSARKRKKDKEQNK